jgi:hypothetical protein
MSFGLGEQYLAILYLRSSFQLLRKRTDTPYWKKEHRNIVRINEENTKQIENYNKRNAQDCLTARRQK